jgi:hypothetical protein
MSKISGFPLGDSGAFSVPGNMFNQKDIPIDIERVSFNPNNIALVVREINASTNLLNKRLGQIEKHISVLEVDKETDTVVMDAAYIKKLSKYVELMRMDFENIVKHAQSR